MYVVKSERGKGNSKMETVNRKKNKPVKKSTAQEAAMDILNLDKTTVPAAAQTDQDQKAKQEKTQKKDKKSNKRFTVYPTDHIWSCLKVMCTIEDKSMTSVVCDILDDYFKDYDYESEKAKAMQIIAQDIL